MSDVERDAVWGKRDSGESGVVVVVLLVVLHCAVLC